MLPTFANYKNYTSFFLTFLIVLCLIFNGCKKKRSEIATLLYTKTQNKVFKNADPDDFADVFQKVLSDESSKLTYPQLIASYYSQNDYEPTFLIQHLQNDDLKTLTAYYDKANEHGLDPKMFQSEQIKALVNKFYSKTGIKTLPEAYQDMAQLEILIANSLINYSNDLQYGVVNPKKIYSRYFMATKRPDSTAMQQVFAIKSFKTYLDSIQPKDPQYLALQKALASGATAPGLSQEETKRILIINLERLRWKNKPTENKYVLVNIPDFHLDVMDSGKSVLGMKVCVGQGRNMHYTKSLVHFDDTDKYDKPLGHETPLLNSKIYMVQVNPVWNIPESIANKEIIKEAADDPYYLSNKNIDVYKNGVKIDPDGIDWATVDKSEYSFKQEPGEDNSLGKIKFLFPNKSSVYLHDTPAKDPFKLSMRAVSHGCVRLGNPQGLALALFGQGDNYDTITKDMAADNPAPTDIDLPKKVAVYITYVTAWPDSAGTIQYRPDVYGQDIVLYAHLEKAVGAGE
jgi:murein L,D-transpeptidase YcbB/YkuD